MANNPNFGFVYYANRPVFDAQQDFVADMPPSIGDTKMLFDVLYDRLQLPGYFGFNWNALSDCLRDLSWIKERRVVLLHHDLPNLPPDDVYIYLDVLLECVSSWKPTEGHELIAAFPNQVTSAIQSILRKGR